MDLKINVYGFLFMSILTIQLINGGVITNGDPKKSPAKKNKTQLYWKRLIPLIPEIIPLQSEMSKPDLSPGPGPKSKNQDRNKTQLKLAPYNPIPGIAPMQLEQDKTQLKLAPNNPIPGIAPMQLEQDKTQLKLAPNNPIPGIAPMQLEQGSGVQAPVTAPAKKNKTQLFWKRLIPSIIDRIIPLQLKMTKEDLSPGPGPSLGQDQLNYLSASVPQESPYAQYFKAEWPYGVVTYYIDKDSYDDNVRRRIQNVMGLIEASSCVIFKEETGKPIGSSGSWLHFTNPNQQRECSHDNIKGENGDIIIVLGIECLKTRDVLHSVLHGLGFKDEVTHPHRDQYIRVLWENILPKYRPLFRVRFETAPYKLVEYDPMSIMHFHDRAYSENGRLSIAPVMPGLVINPSDKLSQLDVMKLRIMYGHECNKRKVSDLIENCKNVLYNLNSNSQLKHNSDDEQFTSIEDDNKQYTTEGDDEAQPLLDSKEKDDNIQSTAEGDDNKKILLTSKEQDDNKQLNEEVDDNKKILLTSIEQDDNKQLTAEGDDNKKLLLTSKETDDNKKLLLTSKEHDDNKQLTAEGDDNKKILLTSKETDDNKQLTAEGDDNQKLLFTSKEQNDNKQLTAEGDDNQKLLLTSKEQDDNKPLTAEGHDKKKLTLQLIGKINSRAVKKLKSKKNNSNYPEIHDLPLNNEEVRSTG